MQAGGILGLHKTPNATELIIWKISLLPSYLSDQVRRDLFKKNVYP